MASEKRLIDADAFLEKMKRTSRYFDVVVDVEEMPTVDAVEVVRCEKCKNAEPYDCTIDGTVHRLYECKKDKTAIGYNKVVAKNDLCSYGDRNGGDGNG